MIGIVMFSLIGAKCCYVFADSQILLIVWYSLRIMRFISLLVKILFFKEIYQDVDKSFNN